MSILVGSVDVSACKRTKSDSGQVAISFALNGKDLGKGPRDVPVRGKVYKSQHHHVSWQNTAYGCGLHRPDSKIDISIH